MKQVVFISHYSMPPQYEQRVKTQKLCMILKKFGYETLIVSASSIHNTSINLLKVNEKFRKVTYDGCDFVHVRVPTYKGNGLKRIYNLICFSQRVYRYGKNFCHPDIIIADVNCINYKKIERFARRQRAKLFLDIRDLWPLSITEYLGISSSNPIIKWLYYQEKCMYKNADGIIFSMEGGKKYIADKGWQKDINQNKIYHINNGIDLQEYNYNITNNVYKDADLDNDRFFKIIYIGAIRKVNDLRVLCDTARIIKHQIENSLIIVFGDGDEKISLENYCKQNNVTNIIFKGFVAKQFIPSILNKGNVNILNYKVTTVLNYGACQNKLFDYLASRRVTVSNAKGYYNLIEKYSCGILTDEYTPESTARAIFKVFNMTIEERAEIGDRAYKVAELYDYSRLAEKLSEIIEGRGLECAY